MIHARCKTRSNFGEQITRITAYGSRCIKNIFATLLKPENSFAARSSLFSCGEADSDGGCNNLLVKNELLILTKNGILIK